MAPLGPAMRAGRPRPRRQTHRLSRRRSIMRNAGLDPLRPGPAWMRSVQHVRGEAGCDQPPRRHRATDRRLSEVARAEQAANSARPPAGHATGAQRDQLPGAEDQRQAVTGSHETGPAGLRQQLRACPCGHPVRVHRRRAALAIARPASEAQAARVEAAGCWDSHSCALRGWERSSKLPCAP
jgi:hypothetical protein